MYIRVNLDGSKPGLSGQFVYASHIRVFAIFIFLVLRRFGVDLASIYFGNRRQIDVKPNRRQIGVME